MKRVIERRTFLKRAMQFLALPAFIPAERIYVPKPVVFAEEYIPEYIPVIVSLMRGEQKILESTLLPDCRYVAFTAKPDCGFKVTPDLKWVSNHQDFDINYSHSYYNENQYLIGAVISVSRKQLKGCFI